MRIPRGAQPRHLHWAQQQLSTTAHTAASSASPHKDPQHSATTAAAAATAHGFSHHGRSLKQTGYDPYGIGYYDPYQAGVTPGFLNVDLNRETGLHVDVGTVAVDVSADKNYYGVGVGNLVGMGAAKDRGWNLQLGGGNILDVSVTKDAGLGLWLLNGLANIQIGPDGRGWETGHIAAQNVPGQATAAAASQSPPEQVTSVVVDETAAGGDESKTAAATGSEVHLAAESAAAATEEPIITEEPIRMDLSTVTASPEPPAPQPAAARSSAARRARPSTYVEPRPVTYVEPREVVIAQDGSDAWSAAAPQDTTALQAAPAAVGPVDFAPVMPLATASEVVAYQYPYAAGMRPVQQVAVPTPTAATAAAVAAAGLRRACEGGTMVAVAGNRFKCKYRRTQQPARASPYYGVNG